MKGGPVTLDQLRYFVAAAKYQHVNKAARSIPISASVVSQTIKGLEEELSCELFVREKRTIKLTPNGTRLLEMSSLLLEQAEGIKSELANAPRSLTGHYRLGASHFLASKILTPAWTKLQNKFPKLTADMHSQPTWALVDSLLAGRLDFALGFNPSPHPHLEFEEVYRGHSEIVVRKNHPVLRHDKKSRYKFLRDYPGTMHINTEKILSSRNHPAFKKLDLEKRVVFSFDGDFVALENLKASNNWAYMIDIIADEFKGHLVTIDVPQRTEAKYSIQIMRHKSRKTDPAMHETFELIKNHFGANWK
jgi:DNA-binding transcriptional LysR family regulator